MTEIYTPSFHAGDRIIAKAKEGFGTGMEGPVSITGEAQSTPKYASDAFTLLRDDTGQPDTLTLQAWDVQVVDPAIGSAFPGTPKSSLATRMVPVPTEEEHLYEKCADCHLFVEPNDSIRQPGDLDLALYVHLHRGDDADEALDESHQARPSGLKANLATWKAYGPQAMRIRFDYQPQQ